MGRPSLNLTPEEKKARAKLAQKKYRASLTPEEKKARARVNLRAQAFRFLKHHATAPELEQARDYIAERKKELIEQKRKNKNCS